MNNARNAGVEVDLAVWKYMCHVWIVLSAFLPEARSAVDFASDWIVNNANCCVEAHLSRLFQSKFDQREKKTISGQKLY